MEIKNYKKRIADDKIQQYLKLFGAICIEGPKYCGKTWTARKHAKSETLLYVNTGEKSNDVELAKISPDIILEGEKPKLIDEWQEATNLWDAIRYDVDKTGLKGQYILTGSSTPKRDGISHSGAGRFGRIFLRTMALYESGDSSGLISLKDICDVNLKNLAKLIIRGGWPANLKYTSEESRIAIKEYIDLIINHDLYKLDGIKRDKHKINLLLKSLARNESTTVSNLTLKNDIKEIDNEDIDVETIANYLDSLDRLFLFDNDEPFSPNIRSSLRVKQQEIKLGVNAIENAANNLLNIKKSIKENQGKEPKILGIISGMTNAAYQRPDGIYVIPITALKN